MSVGKIAGVTPSIIKRVLESLGITNNGIYSASAGGAGYAHKRGLRVIQSNTSGTVDAEEIALREVVAGADADPVTWGSGIRTVSIASTIVFAKVTTGENGFTASPGNSTLWRVFLMAKDSGAPAVLCTPMDNAEALKDDLPVSQDIPAGYKYFRQIDTLYVDSSGNFINTERSGDCVTLDDPEAIYTTASISTEQGDALPALLPRGCTKLWLSLVATTNTSSDMANAIRYPSGNWMQHQYQNIGFNAYGDAPTGMQGPAPVWFPWDGSHGNIQSKSTKPSNGSTGSQSLFLSGWELPV